MKKIIVILLGFILLGGCNQNGSSADLNTQVQRLNQQVDDLNAKVAEQDDKINQLDDEIAQVHNQSLDNDSDG